MKNKKSEISAIKAFETNTGMKVTERDVYHILLSLRPAIIKRIQEKQNGISSAEIMQIMMEGK